MGAKQLVEIAATEGLLPSYGEAFHPAVGRLSLEGGSRERVMMEAGGSDRGRGDDGGGAAAAGRCFWWKTCFALVRPRRCFVAAVTRYPIIDRLPGALAAPPHLDLLRIISFAADPPQIVQKNKSASINRRWASAHASAAPGPSNCSKFSRKVSS